MRQQTAHPVGQYRGNDVSIVDLAANGRGLVEYCLERNNYCQALVNNTIRLTEMPRR